MKRRYRNVAFLMELLINILVFSVACAVLVGLFGKASQLSRQSKQQAAAASEVQNAVEVVKLRGIEGLGAQAGATGASLFFDGSWQPTTDPEAATYEVLVKVEYSSTEAGTLVDIYAAAHPYLMQAGASPLGQALYEMSTAVYQPVKGGAAA